MRTVGVARVPAGGFVLTCPWKTGLGQTRQGKNLGRKKSGEGEFTALL